jgi:hypothetical protein
MEREYWFPLDKFAGLVPMTAQEIRSANLTFALFGQGDLSDIENWFVSTHSLVSLAVLFDE